MSRMLTYVLAGIAIGILIAPDKGSSTRRRLVDSFSDVAEDAQDQANNIAGEIRGTAKNVGEDVKDAAKDIKRDVKNNW